MEFLDMFTFLRPFSDWICSLVGYVYFFIGVSSFSSKASLLSFFSYSTFLDSFTPAMVRVGASR
jgi:hypothetical protein